MTWVQLCQNKNSNRSGGILFRETSEGVDALCDESKRKLLLENMSKLYPFNASRDSILTCFQWREETLVRPNSYVGTHIFCVYEKASSQQTRARNFQKREMHTINLKHYKVSPARVSPAGENLEILPFKLPTLVFTFAFDTRNCK